MIHEWFNQPQPLALGMCIGYIVVDIISKLLKALR